MSPKGNITLNARKKYILWHYRFVYLGSTKLRNLYKITTFNKPIVIAVNYNNIYEVYVFIKFKN